MLAIGKYREGERTDDDAGKEGGEIVARGRCRAGGRD